MEQLCKNTTSSNLICFRQSSKGIRFLGTSPLKIFKRKQTIVTVQYEGMFVLCPHLILILVTVQHYVFSEQGSSEIML